MKTISPAARAALASVILAACFTTSLLAADAEPIQRGNLRVSVSGGLSPHSLPRHGSRGVSVTIGGHVRTTDRSSPPQLRRIELDINSHGHLDYGGLPVCHLTDIQPSTNTKALQACPGARVGEGLFFAEVAAGGQAPFPSRGRLIAFNGIEGGHHVIFAHVYGTDPLPTSYTVPFVIGHAKGTFGTTLTASLPHVTGKSSFITGIKMSLHRSFRSHGRTHNYLSAGCPAPPGFSVVPFDFMRASFTFSDRKLSSVLHRTCRAVG